MSVFYVCCVCTGIKIWSYYFQLSSFIIICFFFPSPQMWKIKSKCEKQKKKKKNDEDRKALGNRRAGCRFLTVLWAHLAAMRSHAVAHSLMGQVSVTCHCTPIVEAGIFLQTCLLGNQIEIISVLVADVNWS